MATMPPRPIRPDALEYAVRFLCGFVFFAFLGFAFSRSSEAMPVVAVIAGGVGGVLACLFGDRLWTSMSEVLRNWWWGL